LQAVPRNYDTPAETPDRKMLQGDQPVNRPDAHC